MMQRDKNDTSDIENWSIADTMCDSWGYCGGYNPSDYENPYCTLDETLTADWGNTCSDYPEVSGTPYGPASDWITPAAFYLMTVELPAGIPTSN